MTLFAVFLQALLFIVLFFTGMLVVGACSMIMCYLLRRFHDWIWLWR